MGYSCIFSKYVEQLIHSVISFESKESQIRCACHQLVLLPVSWGSYNYHWSLLDLFYVIRGCTSKWDLLVPRQPAETASAPMHTLPLSRAPLISACLCASDETGRLLHLGKRRPIKKYSPVLHKPMVSLLKQSDLQVMCAVWKINLSISLTVFILNKNKIDGWKNIKIYGACLIYFQSFQKYM